MNLSGKAAIVTGGDTGIGSAIVRAFSAQGAAIVIDYLGDSAPAQALVQELTGQGRKAVAVAGDVTKSGDVANLVAQAVKNFGALDLLINNAGVEHRFPFIQTPDEIWDEVIAVNLTGAYLCCKAAARQMIAQARGGRIVNISSIHEDVTAPTNAPYCAAKGGLRMLMRTIAVELAPYKITVNNVAPGAVDTPMDAKTKANPKLDDELLSDIPLHRWGRPDEIAGLVVWLCTEAASYITGATLFIDGGMMRQAGSL